MDYKGIEPISNGVKLIDVENFEPKHTFMGQCFRWNINSDENYEGVAHGKVIEVCKKDKDIYIYNTNVQEFHEIWEEYFDLKTDYSNIKSVLEKDQLLKEAIDYCNGIRILNQEPFEIIISFIISANNRIPMIMRAIENLSKNFGREINYNGNTYYSFPTVEELHKASLEDIEKCGVGFRGKYIKDTVEKIYSCKDSIENNIYDIDFIKNQNDDECHKYLQNFTGIGPKVADCIMLFSMKKTSAFPVDVWVKKAMMHFYVAPDVSLKKIREFGRDKFSIHSGIAQQYLFYYARETNIQI